MTNSDRIFPLSLLYIVWLLVASCSGGEIAPALVSERKPPIFMQKWRDLR